MVISLLSIILFLIDNQKNVNSSADYRYNSYNLGLDSKINSDLLTSLARSYVITREKKYLDKYLNVVQMLEGTAPWPDGTKKSYDQRLQEMNFTTDELNKLDQSNKLSLNLVNLEDTAFSAVEILADKNNTQLNSDEIEQWISAINTIHGESYENEVSKIKAPVDDFFVMLNQRTVTELHDVEKNSESLGFTALILVIIILVILLIAYITIERRVIKPTSLLVKEVKLVTDGDLTRKIPMTGKDELTNLSSAFNDMITKTSNLIQDIRQQSELVSEFSEQLNEISSNSLKFTSEQSKAVASKLTRFKDNLFD
jgi:methyl-accepting chemotaxis protein